MPQPLGLTVRLGRYIVGQKLARRSRFPIVLMLEPLHTCNLACIGCTPDRHEGRKEDWLTLRACLDSVDECGAPIVSICGGEPLIYDDLLPLIEGIVARRRYAIVCTNALLLERRLPDLAPSPFLSFAVHLDGLADTHDRITQRPGSFETAVRAMRAAKAAGHRVTTNTTVYSASDDDEVVELFAFLKKDVGIDGLITSPGYDFDQTGEDLFLSREEVVEKFRKILSRSRRGWFENSSTYLDFLEGKVELTCTAWGNPTRTPTGWQAPCYMLRDSFHESYAAMLREVDWTRYGPESQDPRCRRCMLHCGFEPTVAIGRGVSVKQQLRSAWHAVR